MKSHKDRKKTTKRPLTFNYIIFYMLFWPDTYRIIIGLLLALLIAPVIIYPDVSTPGKIILFLMLATIGYAISAAPGRAVAGFFQKQFLKIGKK
jgi:hypothetical protein